MRKFKAGISRLGDIKLTCTSEPFSRLKRRKSGASCGKTSYLKTGSGFLGSTFWQSVCRAGRFRAAPSLLCACAKSLRHLFGVALSRPAPRREVSSSLPRGAREGQDPRRPRDLTVCSVCPTFGVGPELRAEVCCLLLD